MSSYVRVKAAQTRRKHVYFYIAAIMQRFYNKIRLL